MGLFGKRKKRKQEELEKQAKAKEAALVEAQKAEEAKKTELVDQAKSASNSNKKTTPNKVEGKSENHKGLSGKYEVYPEAGLYKYHLKASNGEVLVVSFGYSTRKGAKKGIETFKNAVLEGNFEITTDKAGYTHFDLFGTRGARVIAIGEFYKTSFACQQAVESVKNFSVSTKIVDLEAVPENEVKETKIDKQDIETKDSGKYQLYKEGPKAFYVRLIASNGQVLLVTQKYASKQAALNGVESIKKAITNQNFTIYKDKQNRFQFNLYTANKQLIVSGETYPQKANCLSAIQSVIRFSEQAEVVQI